MRNPSSPCARPCCQQDSGFESSLVWNSYVSRERSNCCFRSQVCSTVKVSITTVGRTRWGLGTHKAKDRATERALWTIVL